MTHASSPVEPDQAAAPALDLPFLDHDNWETYKLHRRFDRMGRLVGDDNMKRLMDSHVMVLGLGGVGSYAAEMIVRSGVGKVTIVDFDQVCVTNVNRQLHAMKGTIGRYKAEVLAERFQLINPKATIVAHNKFYNADTSEELLSEKPDYLIDAIDSVTWKAHLLDACIRRELKVVSSAGAGGRMDPTMLHIADLGDTKLDPLARQMRKILRQKYGHTGRRLGIPTIYSTEPITAPHELAYDNGQGFRCVCPQGDNQFFTCDNRNLILGTAGFLTATFGMTCSSVVVRAITGLYTWPQATPRS